MTKRLTNQLPNIILFFMYCQRAIHQTKQNSTNVTKQQLNPKPLQTTNSNILFMFLLQVEFIHIF